MILSRRRYRQSVREAAGCLGERPACPGVESECHVARGRRAKSPSRGRRAFGRINAACAHMDGRDGKSRTPSRLHSAAGPTDYALTARCPWKRWRNSVFRSLPVAVCGRRRRTRRRPGLATSAACPTGTRGSTTWSASGRRADGRSAAVAPARRDARRR